MIQDWAGMTGGRGRRPDRSGWVGGGEGVLAVLIDRAGRPEVVLNCASPNGLSLDTCGRLWDWVTPRSASRNVTGLEVSRCYEE